MRAVSADGIYSLFLESHVFMDTVRSNLLLVAPDETEQELIDTQQATYGKHGWPEPRIRRIRKACLT